MENEVWVVLDALRRKRSANDYTDDIVTPDMVDECVAQARSLQTRLKKDLAARHPHLLEHQAPPTGA